MTAEHKQKAIIALSTYDVIPVLIAPNRLGAAVCVSPADPSCSLRPASSPCLATPLVAGVWRFGRALKYGERAKVRARGVLEMSLI
jgi:hypothetical protein